MSRRSTRKRKLLEQDTIADEPTTDNMDDGTFIPQLDEEPDRGKKNLKKRQRTTVASRDNAKHVRGRRGALKQLVEMPLDLLFEVTYLL